MSRSALLVVYDVLFYFALHDSRLRRDVVVEYLHRTTNKSPDTCAQSRLRAFERFKKSLSALGIEHHSECDLDDAWFVIDEPDRAIRHVTRLLDAHRGRLIPTTK